MARLLSVNVGLPHDIEWKGRTVHTAIWKDPVRRRCRVGRLNLDGDGQGDLAGHGGEQRAVFVYQIESYRYWQEQLARTDFVHGQFGENFTIEGLPDDIVCIGDRYQIGSALFEVTQPRVTCYRVGIRMNEPRMPALLTSSGRPGFYLRVLQEGEVGPGDGIVKAGEGKERMTVAEINALLYSPNHPRDRLERALRIEALSPGWRWSFQALLQRHVTKHLRRHWPTTRIVWRGDGHYGRVEAMDWADEHDTIDYIFGLAGNAALDALVAETADNLRFHHAKSSQTKLRTYASFTYQAGRWTRPRKVVARLECSLQPDAGGTTSNGMRQEVDIRYVVTSLKGSAQHLYENVYCQRGQMENLIKLHKAQLASDRMSCHSATANQVRLALHTAAFWLMHGVRAAIPKTNPLACAEFATIRERLIKIGVRVIEHIARIRVQLPTSCPEGSLFRTVALGLMRSGP